MLSALWIGLLAAPACASDSDPGARLPDRFAVDTMRFTFSQQQGNAVYAQRTVELTAGGGRLAADGTTRTFTYTREQAVDLLNTLFAIHFFALPNHYATRPLATLTADGMVVLAKQTSTSVSNRTCVTIGQYEKCVHYGVQGPAELDRLVTHIFNEAQKVAPISRSQP